MCVNGTLRGVGRGFQNSPKVIKCIYFSVLISEIIVVYAYLSMLLSLGAGYLNVKLDVSNILLRFGIMVFCSVK